MLRFLLISSLLGSAALAGCGSTAPSEDDCADGKCDDGTLELCTAIRGNGKLITAHFASLARIVEHYGPIDGAAGGSSASISIFMMESMQQNPATRSCDGRPCDDTETAARIALLLKTFPGYLQHLSTTEEAALLGELVPVVEQIQRVGISELLDEDVDSGVNALINILENDDLGDLINPEVVQLLISSPTPEKHARDILEGVESLGSFSAESDKILIRPGLLSFTGLAEKLGRAGDFYAGNGPADADAMEAFMSACATQSLGMTWLEAAGLAAGNGTCGNAFDAMLGSYRAALAEDGGSFTSRIDENVGASMPALVSTSVMSGSTAESFSKARVDYNAGRDYTFVSDFDDVSFGYWGQKANLNSASKNGSQFGG